MSIRSLAQKWKVRPALIYSIIYDLECTGKLSIQRKNRHLILTEKDIKAIEDELRRRGYAEIKA